MRGLSFRKYPQNEGERIACQLCRASPRCRHQPFMLSMMDCKAGKKQEKLQLLQQGSARSFVLQFEEDKPHLRTLPQAER